ncbi:MAG: TlpA family protein disulfide reductase [Candidatus Kariarchaeaceae archaeon]|jgi:thioredoxin-related protein
MKHFTGVILLLILVILPNSALANSFIVPYMKLDRTQASLADFSGGFLFVEAFTTWCDSCKLEMEQLQIVHDYVSDQIAMLSLSVDTETDTLQKIKEYKEDFNAEWEFGSDHTNMFEEKYDVRVYPTLYLFSQTGELVELWWGYTTATKLLTDMNNHFNVSNHLDQLEGKEEYRIFASSLLSNPLFFITAGFVLMNLIVLIKSRRNNRQAINIKQLS